MVEKEIPKENIKEEEEKAKALDQEKDKEIPLETEDKDKDAKQEFLTKELIDKGYNPEDFSNYVSRTKGYSTAEINLDIFKKLVDQFKTDRLKQQSEELKGSEEQLAQEQLFDARLYKAYSHSIPGVKQEVSPLAEKQEKIIVQINDPQKKEGGVFTSDFYTYQVVTDAIQAKTRRVFEDFEFLRNKLVATYPNIYIPPLVEKGFFDVNDLPITILRMRYLNRFFMIIMRKKILRTSALVYSFLTLSQEEYEVYKKKNKANPVYKSMEEIPTIKGTIDINFTKEVLIESQKIPIFIPPNVYRYERLNEVIELLMNDFIQTSLHMKELSEIFNDLSSTAWNSNQGEVKKKAFTMLGDLTANWASSYLKQKDLFDFQLRECFDYIRRDFNEFNALINDYNSKKSTFENFENKLLNKKESLFNSKKYAKWEVVPNQGEVVNYPQLEKNKEECFERMLPKETEISKKNRHVFCFTAQKFLSEYSKVMKYQGERLTRLINNLEKLSPTLLADTNNLISLLKLKIS